MERIRLGELVKGNGLFKDGDWIESKDQDLNGEVKLIQLADIGIRNFINKSNRFMNYEKALELKCTFLEKGDILIARMPDPIGRCCEFPFEEVNKYVTVVDIAIFRNKNNDLDNRYLVHYINSESFLNKVSSGVTGTTRQRISRKKLEAIEIPLPSLDQQKAIAAKLDKADEIRRLNQQLIDKYDALTQSLFIDMFGDPVKNEMGWEKVKLGDLCGVGSSKRVFVEELKENGIPFYRGTEVGALGNDEMINPTLFISEHHYHKLKKDSGIPQVGDLLMPSICPDGRIFEVKNNDPFYFKDGRVLWVKVNQTKINSTFLKKNLKANFAKNYSKIASGTTFAELKIFALKDLIISNPPISLQNQFAERIAVIEAQKQFTQDALAKSEALFNSLLQESFS
ncbi:restriction endonuclease subunit S [Soonwooa sp.]|uniref:restriction endonuclease subunit S n=1 Tax=Soonwooa sp. TaxID=1938592 RepID=UPI002631C986|nr:restriction endonuclease subunit S [Soonwooa sp.]